MGLKEFEKFIKNSKKHEKPEEFEIQGIGRINILIKIININIPIIPAHTGCLAIQLFFFTGNTCIPSFIIYGL